MASTEDRLDALEKRFNNLQKAFEQAMRNQVPITAKSDESYAKCPQVDENTSGVAENDSAIMDIAELSDENDTAIEELAEMIDNLEERVSALEE